MARQRLEMRLGLSEQPVATTWPCRTIAPADVPALGALMLAAYQGTIDYEGETLEQATDAARDTIAGQYGPLLEHCSFLSEQAGQAAGACMITLWDDMPLVSNVMVHPEWKNQGLGSFLIGRSAAALFEQGYRELRLFVTEGNASAQRVYEKLGFQVQENSRT